MLAYFLSMENLNTLDIVPVSDHTITDRITLDGTSRFAITYMPAIPVTQTGDRMPFVIIKNDDNEIIHQGVLKEIQGSDGVRSKVIQTKQIDSLFKGKLHMENEDLIASTGIEDFIASMIEDNFIDSGDSMLDLSYITVTASTHTMSTEIPDNNRDVMDLRAYMSQAMINHGIFLTYEFTDDALNITIAKKVQSTLNIDAKVTDVSNYTESLNSNITAKIRVKWNNAGVVTDKTYFLLNDLAYTEDGTSINRAIGTTTAISIETDEEATVIERVEKEFNRNKYDHAFNLSIYAKSKLYDPDELYVGHVCKIVTDDSAVYDSIITSVVLSNSTNLINIKCGLLPVSLAEKIKEDITWQLEA